MLVLSRYVGQKVIINEDIIVTINSVDGRQVKLGFDAPMHVEIHREEVQERINKERSANDEGAKNV